MRYKEVKHWLDDFKEALEKGDNKTTTDITLMRALVEYITINDDGIEVKFKCGARVKQEYIK